MTFIDLQELQVELDKSKNTVARWAAQACQAADECKHSHKQKMKASGGELSLLEDRYKQVDRLAQQVQQRIAADDTEAATLQDMAASLQAEKQALQKRLAQMQRGYRTQAEECSLLDVELSKQEMEQAVRVSALDKVLRLYEHVLGMQLLPGEDELVVVFTQIDPQEPAEEFSFAVKVQPDNTYEVTRCEPPVEGMARLTEQLRQDNNFAGFCKAMRKEFKQMVAA